MIENIHSINLDKYHEYSILAEGILQGFSSRPKASISRSRFLRKRSSTSLTSNDAAVAAEEPPDSIVGLVVVVVALLVIEAEAFIADYNSFGGLGELGHFLASFLLFDK